MAAGNEAEVCEQINVVSTALCWVIPQRVSVIPCRRFRLSLNVGTDDKMGLIGGPKTSVRNYHSPLRNNPEERNSHVLRGGSFKSRTSM